MQNFPLIPPLQYDCFKMIFSCIEYKFERQNKLSAWNWHGYHLDFSNPKVRFFPENIIEGFHLEDIKNLTIPPDIIPAGHSFSKEITPLKFLAREPLTGKSNQAGKITSGPIPNGKNGILTYSFDFGEFLSIMPSNSFPIGLSGCFATICTAILLAFCNFPLFK